MGAIGGGLWNFGKSFRNSPRVRCFFCSFSASQDSPGRSDPAAPALRPVRGCVGRASADRLPRRKGARTDHRGELCRLGVPLLRLRVQPDPGAAEGGCLELHCQRRHFRRDACCTLRRPGIGALGPLWRRVPGPHRGRRDGNEPAAGRGLQTAGIQGCGCVRLASCIYCLHPPKL